VGYWNGIKILSGFGFQANLRKKFGLDDYLLEGGSKSEEAIRYFAEIKNTFKVFNAE
jgi:hypothetical protein